MYYHTDTWEFTITWVFYSLCGNLTWQSDHVTVSALAWLSFVLSEIHNSSSSVHCQIFRTLGFRSFCICMILQSHEISLKLQLLFWSVTQIWWKLICEIDSVFQDLGHTFPGQPAIDSPEGQASRRRILPGYSFRDSRVGYCQVSSNTHPPGFHSCR